MPLYLKIGFAAAFVLVAEPLVAQRLMPAQPETVGMSSERLERLTESLQDYVDDNRLAGAVALVVRRGKILSGGCRFSRQGNGCANVH